MKVTVGEAVMHTEPPRLSVCSLPVSWLKRRLEKCSQDLLEYVDEFRELSKAALTHLARLSTDKAELKGEVENLLTRVERAQRDIDYFGSLTDSNACVEVHEDLLEQQLLEEAEEKKRLKLMLNASKSSLFFRTSVPRVHAGTGIRDFHLQGGLGCVNTRLIKPMYMQKKLCERREKIQFKHLLC